MSFRVFLPAHQLCRDIDFRSNAGEIGRSKRAQLGQQRISLVSENIQAPIDLEHFGGRRESPPFSFTELKPAVLPADHGFELLPASNQLLDFQVEGDPLRAQ